MKNEATKAMVVLGSISHEMGVVVTRHEHKLYCVLGSSWVKVSAAGLF
jgi:metal-dependent HD superfamily phosphatase/phosphodiesterase